MAKHRASEEGFMSRPIPFLRVDEPLMVFGGPYSNLEATRAVLDEAVRLSISADRIICTGDVVAYGADAAATVDLVRDRVCHVVIASRALRPVPSTAVAGFQQEAAASGSQPHGSRKLRAS